MPVPRAQGFFRYLPARQDLVDWGLYLLDAGYTRIPAGAPYPPLGHPADHHFTWQRGRTLSSFALVYITRGQGRFESRTAGGLDVATGDLFILFPGEWHRYRPSARTGWDEYWIDLSGDITWRLFGHEPFHPARPLLRLGHDPALVGHFAAIIEQVERAVFGFEYAVAALAFQVVARTVQLARGREFLDGERAAVLQQAQARLQEGQTGDLRRLARELGVGYSWFRHRFKDYAGVSPRQFDLQVRLKKACHLLAATDLPVGEIARQLGFDSPGYFTRLFGAKMGCPPSAWRARASGAADSPAK